MKVTVSCTQKVLGTDVTISEEFEIKDSINISEVKKESLKRSLITISEIIDETKK